jgi:hypothetical protein
MSETQIRPVEPADVPAVVAMVYELAAYEKAPESCRLTEAQLHSCLFGDHPALYGHVALDAAGTPVGFMLWFLNFSTWEGTHEAGGAGRRDRPAAARHARRHLRRPRVRPARLVGTRLEPGPRVLRRDRRVRAGGMGAVPADRDRFDRTRRISMTVTVTTRLPDSAKRPSVGYEAWAKAPVSL